MRGGSQGTAEAHDRGGRRPRCRQCQEGGGQGTRRSRRRGTIRSRGARENPLRRRIPPRVSMECRRGGGQQGVTESQNPLRRGMSLYYSERSWGKIGASEDFTFPPVVTLYIINFWVLPRVLSNMRCCSGLLVPLEMSSFEDSVYCRSAAIIPVSNGSAWGSLSLVMRESQQWVRYAPERLKLP